MSSVLLNLVVLLPENHSVTVAALLAPLFSNFVLFPFRVMAVVLVYQHGGFLMITLTIAWHCQQMKSKQYGRPNRVGGTGFHY
jgi:hypothetical protein